MPPPIPVPPSLTKVAILGGGLTGLSSAFHLSRRYPNVGVTLVEKSERLGGWVRSERADVKFGGGGEGGEVDVLRANVLLEAGPRTLRPNGKSVLELVNLLGLESSLLTVPRTSPAARNRFLYIPGTRGLTPIPSSFSSLLTSPLSHILIPAVLGEPFRSPLHLPTQEDQGTGEDKSVDAFLRDHFGAEFAETFGSALIHGIYAADSRTLSVRAAFPFLWDAMVRGNGSVVRGMMKGAVTRNEGEEEDYELGGVMERMKDVSVFSFRNGVETVVSALEQDLNGRRNVEIIKGDGVVSIEQDSGSSAGFLIKTASGTIISASHIVSALPLPALNRLITTSKTGLTATTGSTTEMGGHVNSSALSSPNANAISTLTITEMASQPKSTVTVVNMVFPPTSRGSPPIHPPGFGYLVPRLREGASEEETRDHAGVLGTVFDSCALPEQDLYERQVGENPEARFTKVTMMLGGPHASTVATQTDDPEVLVKVLERHLGRPGLPTPVLVRRRYLKECIPTPAVGHLDRIRSLEGLFDGRLVVVGAGVGGVSVPDCIRQGRKVALF